MSKIPILWNHDPSNAIGSIDQNAEITVVAGKLTPEMLANIGVGFQILDMKEIDGTRYVTRARITDFGIFPVAAPPASETTE